MSKNKITKSKVLNKIENVEYTKVGVKTTICTLTLKNGFEVVGTSSCVDPANYNESIGRQIAHEDAVNKVMMLEGYLLQEELAKPEPGADYHAKELLSKGIGSCSEAVIEEICENMFKMPDNPDRDKHQSYITENTLNHLKRAAKEALKDNISSMALVYAGNGGTMSCCVSKTTSEVVGLLECYKQKLIENM